MEGLSISVSIEYENVNENYRLLQHLCLQL